MAPTSGTVAQNVSGQSKCEEYDEVISDRCFKTGSSIDLRKCVLKRIWINSTTKNLKKFIQNQRKLSKDKRCSMAEIEKILSMLPSTI